MTSSDGKITEWIVGTACGLVLAALGVVFIRVGLAEAHKLASALGIMINVTGLAVSIYSMLMARRSLDQVGDNRSAEPDEVHNTICGSHFAQPVVQARDVRQLTFDSRTVIGRGVAVGAELEQKDWVGRATGERP